MTTVSQLNETVLLNLKAVTQIASQIHTRQNFDSDTYRGPYPADISKEQILSAAELDPDLTRPDTVIEKNLDSTLTAIHYTQAYQPQFKTIVSHLMEAEKATDDPAFKAYLNAAATCFQSTDPDDYRDMMVKWLEAREHPLQLVMVWDETYSDTFLGIKGSMDAALFVADEALSAVVQRPVKTWDTFAASFRFPGKPNSFSGFYTRVYEILALGGALPGMKLRAWNLPDDLSIRETMGSHQLILRENTLNTLEHDLLPMVKKNFVLTHDDIPEKMFLHGLLWTLTSHELGHNLACYEAQKNLFDLNDTFEELKANIFPVIWVMDQHARCLLTAAETEAAIAVYLALDLMDCVLARTVPGRRSYARATWIQMNRLEQLGALSIQNDRIHLNLSQMESANRTLLNEILQFMAEGQYNTAASYAERYGSPVKNLDI